MIRYVKGIFRSTKKEINPEPVQIDINKPYFQQQNWQLVDESTIDNLCEQDSQSKSSSQEFENLSNRNSKLHSNSYDQEFSPTDLDKLEYRKEDQDFTPLDLDKQEDKQGDKQFNKQEQFQEEPYYMDYVIGVDESLYGIALKFNIHISQLQKINDISEIVFPGQHIQVPNISPERMYRRVQSIFPKSNKIVENVSSNIWDKKDTIHQFRMYYCTSDANIEGNLILTKDVIFFDPDCQVSNTPFKYKVCISINDINEAVHYQIDNQQGGKDFLLQILLSGIGKPQLEKKYRRQLQKWKNLKRSIATIFFRHSDREKAGIIFISKRKRDNCVLASKFLTDAIGENQHHNQKNYKCNKITKVPYLDLIIENLKIKQIENDLNPQDNKIFDMMNQRADNIWSTIAYIPCLKEEDSTLTNDQYIQLIESTPAVFRLAKWILKFDTMRDGSSYSNMLGKLRQENPIMIIIQDIDKRIFGSYIPVELKQSHQGFYGNGETYLFRFDESGQMYTYRATEKNNNFICSDSDGIGIGCGDKNFGLYISKSLANGESDSSDTFDNDRLSESQYFKIKKIEIWTISLY